uniref:C-type lectin domain-containing protein n=1 Tax=Dicentrarchus labrax TaxID=13489 RepID=A0A8C4ECH2_DICLA
WIVFSSDRWTLILISALRFKLVHLKVPAQHGRQCYYFSTNYLTWSKSRDECQQKGGDLVQIDSREDRNWTFYSPVCLKCSLNEVSACSQSQYRIQNLEQFYFCICNVKINE